MDGTSAAEGCSRRRTYQFGGSPVSGAASQIHSSVALAPAADDATCGPEDKQRTASGVNDTETVVYALHLSMEKS